MSFPSDNSWINLFVIFYAMDEGSQMELNGWKQIIRWIMDGYHSYGR